MAYANPQPVSNDHWSFSTSRTRTSSFSSLTKDSPEQSPQRLGFWKRCRNLNKGSLFRNAGLDENGELKSEYVETQDVDWGVPDEWLARERRPIY